MTTKAKAVKSNKAAVAIDAAHLHSVLIAAHNAEIAKLQQDAEKNEKRISFELDSQRRITVAQIAAFAEYAPDRANDVVMASIGTNAAKYTMRKVAFTLDAIQRGDLKAIYNTRHKFMKYCAVMLQMLKSSGGDTLQNVDYYSKAAKQLICAESTTPTQRSTSMDCLALLYGCVELVAGNGVTKAQAMRFDLGNKYLQDAMEAANS